MKLSSPDEPATPGLRERKKVKTRAAIRRHALRLFREQGYTATTVEQIAEAAEVSPSTFFRYFPTKEDVVLQDDLDELMVAAFEAQPRELSAIEALRRAIRAVYENLPAEEMAEQLESIELTLSVPEVRAAMLDEFSKGIQMIAGVVAKRVGRQPDDVLVRTFAGAVIGVVISATLTTGTASTNYFAQMDEGLAVLEAGIAL